MSCPRTLIPFAFADLPDAADRLSRAACAAVFLLLAAAPSLAAQVDIAGPPGSDRFGAAVAFLPSGNFVVVDHLGVIAGEGAVYLYSADGKLISTLTGSSPDDHVGGAGIVVLDNGNFLVVSPDWDNGAVVDAGAVTWVDGVTGFTGPVSPAIALVSPTNSLVGSSINDSVGSNGVVELDNGNYVVVSSSWSSPTADLVGAVTWGDGDHGVTGPVSAGNSLIGGHVGDHIGSSQINLPGTTSFNLVIPLANGNYVVASPEWDNPDTFTGGLITDAGAVTWASGTGGTVGLVSSTNSLVGSHFDDFVGGSHVAFVDNVIALTNGNYAVASADWDGGTTATVDLGAVTWGNGNGGTVGEVGASNSLLGVQLQDSVGDSGLYALTNGNYVVLSPAWDNGGVSDAGAVTWCDGSAATSTVVSTGNSLVGTHQGDRVGQGLVQGDDVALANGNYVVVSVSWDSNTATDVGAVTWGDGASGTVGSVSSSNSLVGTTPGDGIGVHITALTNGNYVVASPAWDNGPIAQAGAATWGDGNGGTVGPVSTANSLVGAHLDDGVGGRPPTALADGNYVVRSPSWSNGMLQNAGAVTWGHGGTGSSGVVSTSNSLVGASAEDFVGVSVLALEAGAYAVGSRFWDMAPHSDAGAVTWCHAGACIGTVAAGNSLVGEVSVDRVGRDLHSTGAGHYVVNSDLWDNGATSNAGAITLASAGFPLVGTIEPWNSVAGSAANGGYGLNWDFDPSGARLLVGRPSDNLVTLFIMDQIFFTGMDL